MSETEVDFETALAELEKLVASMETGELTLEDSLRAFERGIALTRQCQQALEKAQLRVDALMPDGTSAALEDIGGDPGTRSS